MKEYFAKRRGSTKAKVTAWILLILFSAFTVFGMFAASLMLSEDFYRIPEEAFLKNNRTAYLSVKANEILSNALQDEETDLSGSNVTGYTIEKDEEILESRGTEEGTPYSYPLCYRKTTEGEYIVLAKEEGEILETQQTPEAFLESSETVETLVTVYLDPQLKQHDNLYYENQCIHLAYALRYHIFWMIGLSLILAVSAFVFLVYSAGFHGKDAVLRPWTLTKIPADLFYLVAGSILLVLFLFGSEGIFYSNILLVCIPIGVLLTVFLIMEFVHRLRCGNIWKRTILYRTGLFLNTLIQNLPLISKGLAVYALFSFIQLLCTVIVPGHWYLLFFWLLENIILFPLVTICLLMMRKLERGAQMLAEGNLTEKIDTTGLIGNFKRHGENLNRIAEGMTKAVEEQMKSERMKTELITNVSHDIKTPLTSIINYADLIQKEETDNEAIHRYSEVLERQSRKLKHLIEDLIEASKASTGNLEIELAPCNVKVLVSQAAGEYEERLKAEGLTLVTGYPEGDLTILSDGRRLWRVLDNLLNNIQKYAQRGTRVYLDVEETEDQCSISFKNISREALNISPDELMERFVRGDHARTSEGNGLGLSIAKSLTELMGGTLDLSIDGDLFKVTICFPKIK